jgi:hypothetical protein
VLSPESKSQKSFGRLRPASPFVNSIIGTLRPEIKVGPFFCDFHPAAAK